MRQTRKSQLALREARIEDIKRSTNPRDEFQRFCLGLQHLRVRTKDPREALLDYVVEEHAPPGMSNRNVGRPGMELRRILAFSIKHAADFDRLR